MCLLVIAYGELCNGISFTGCYCRGPGYEKCHLNIGIAFTLRSAANYVRLGDGAREYSGKLIVAKRNFKRGKLKAMDTNSILLCVSCCMFFRTGIFRCATIEEIEAEKSSIEKDVKERMEKTIETVRTNFNSIRTGRANPAILDRVEVEYYGTPVSLKSIAQISTPDSASLLVQPYDKSSLKVIEKAIVSSDLGLTPNNDGEVIRLSLPQLTSERRKHILPKPSGNIKREIINCSFKVAAEKSDLGSIFASHLLQELSKVVAKQLRKERYLLLTKADEEDIV
ncbi:Ribosome-recycling factor, chloroplastic [Vitis vinifera]|uniref:Ribosome-recycling factor, chloroplastic n=1 Tax=Vitis vinifera TaxID=29760 RepID=A0A438F5P0_VITVI|nr:Ribosome-recycling factor, chloroplastic [Vitis vinifera]